MTKNIVLLIIFLSLPGCEGNSEKAIDYNNTIVRELNNLSELEDALSKKKGAAADKALEDFRRAIPISRKKIQDMGKFKDSDSFEQTALELCDFYQEVLDGKWDDRVDEFEKKEIELYARLKQAQKDFAERFKIDVN